ncbi:MAG: hypothetical protein Q4C96_07190 [Planctomycetia bacterium]|nr:hypothetical protein [Planctomycetia bacterium]
MKKESLKLLYLCIFLSFLSQAAFGQESFDYPFVETIETAEGEVIQLNDNADFSGKVIKNEIISRENGVLRNINFSKCRFINTTIKDVHFENCSFKEAKFYEGVDGNSSISLNSVEGCDFTDARFISERGNSQMQISFDGKYFLQTQNYKSKRLENLRIIFADYSNMDFSDFVLVNSAIFTKRQKGIRYQNALFCEGCHVVNPGSNAKEMIYSTLNYQIGVWSGVSFFDDVVEGVDFSGMTFIRCRFNSLKGTNFTDAKFIYPEFYDSMTLEQIKQTWNYKSGRMDLLKLPEGLQKQVDAELEKEGRRVKTDVGIGINLSEFKTTGTCNIEAKTLHESQSTWVKVAVYKKVNDQDVRVDTMEDLVKITTSLFVMQDTRNVIPNYGQPLEKSQDRTKMWNCDIVTDTYQTPCSGPRYSGSYLKSSISYATTGFTMDLDYDFIRGNDGNGNIYGDAYGYQKGIRPGNVDDINNKLSFVANGGVKFGSTAGMSENVFEAALLDVEAMVSMILAKLQELNNNIPVEITDIPANLVIPGYAQEEISRLLHGIAYGCALKDIFPGQTINNKEFGATLQPIDYLLEAYSRSKHQKHMSIIVEAVTDTHYGDISIITQNLTTYESDPQSPLILPSKDGNDLFDGHIYLQSHWGSGVVYKNIQIVKFEE